MRYEGLGVRGERRGVRRFFHTSYLILPTFLLLAWLYGDVIRLPFYFDDLNQVPYAGTHTLAQIWTADAGSAYYRPLGSAIWHIAYRWWGAGSAAWLHALNGLLHGINGLLLAWLGEMLATGRPRPRLSWRGALAALLFWLYPFSYQAVPWIGALFHLLVTTLVLASLLCYRLARLSGRRGWTFVGLACALLAPFTHENGLLIPLLVGLVAWTQRQPARQVVRDGLLWSAPAVVWLLVRLFLVSAGPSPLRLNNAETLFQNAAYFAQGVGYPLTAVGGWLRDRFGLNDLLLALVLTALALALAAAAQRRGGRAVLWSWGWAAVAVMPALPFLSFNYVISGPRLLMLASAGICWLWADVFVRLAGTWTTSRLRWSATAVLCLLLLGQNALFVRQRVRQHDLLGSAVRQAVRQVQAANAAGHSAYVLNMPSWMAARRTVYPLGHEGITFLPDYIPSADLLRAQVDEPLQVELLTYADLKPEMPYYYEAAGGGLDWPRLNAEGGAFFLTTFAPTAMTVREVGVIGAAAAPDDAPDDAPAAVFTGPAGGTVHLAGTAVWDGAAVTVTLSWRAAGAVTAAASIFVHAVDASGQLVGQGDGWAIAGIYPPTLWPPETIITDVRYIPLVDPPAAIRVGLYNPVGGARWPAHTPAGQPWPDDALLIPVGQKPGF